MPDRNPPGPGGLLRRISPAAAVIAFALAMTACVLGVVIWKSLEAKATALAGGQTDIQNLTHSLAEHASHTIRSADIAMAGMVDLLKYRDPLPERFNPYLAETVSSLPQLREIGVLDVDGKWRYSSLPETPRHDNSDRSYFIYHRDKPGSALRINEPLQSRLTGRSTIILSKRIDKQDGSFAGVLTAAIDSDYFNRFYKTFQLGPDGSISLLRDDGAVLIRWPFSDRSTNLAGTDLFSRYLKLSSVGYYRIISPFDGIAKYFGYEETPHYPTVVTLAMSEDWLLADWRRTLRTDAIVAGVLLCMIVLLAALLSLQLRSRTRTVRALRQSEAHYRLLADNIADIIILIDARGLLRYVSRSAEPVLGLRPTDIVGKSCFDLVHPDDRESVKSATTRLDGVDGVSTVVFRHYRGDGTLAWVESKFKLASEPSDPARTEFLCVIRDVTERKRMEDELDPTQPPPHPARGDRRTDRADQPAHLRRLPAPRIRSLRRDFGAAARYRQFQGLQRHLRTPGRRPLPAGGCESHRRCGRQYVRPGLALWRRGIRRRVAEYFGKRRPETRRDHSADGSGAGHSEHGLQPRIHHHQRGHRRQKPLDARRGRAGGGSRHRALRSQASRPQSQHRVFLPRPAIRRECLDSARRRVRAG
ncbi:PAS domain S-box-containing protein [Bradyrhizobium sp. AZCC 2262]